MLTGADQDLCMRDPGVPGLATLLDSKLFERSVRGCSEAFPIPSEIPAPDYLRYEPGRRCVALYTVPGEPLPFAYAKASRSDPTDSVASPLEPARDFPLILEGLNISVFPFPTDPKVRALARLVGGGGRCRRLLASALPDHPHLHRTTPELLRYRPERRAVFRLGPAARGSVVLKLARKAGFARASHAQRVLQSSEQLQLPRHVGGSERHRMLAFDWIEGRELRDSLRAESPDLADIASVGAALAGLHAQVAQGLPERSTASSVERMRRTAALIGLLAPEHASRANRLADEVTRTLEMAPTVRASIHGDFYDNQVILTRDGIALLDLDEAALGNPLDDLGLFVAHLLRDVLLGDLSPVVAAAARAALIEGYGQATGIVSTESLRAHVALAYLGLGPSVFRKSRDRWPEFLDKLLDGVAAELAQGEC